MLLLLMVFEKKMQHKSQCVLLTNMFDPQKETDPDFDLELDPDHIQGVLVELLENALRASNEREVVLEAYDSMDGFVFKVSDYGPGFSEEALEHAFDPFFSEQPAGRRKGLGLSTARRLVEAHGGSISLRNRRSAGTTGGVVCVTLRTNSESALTDGLSLGSSRKVA